MKKILNRRKLEQEDSNEAGVFILNFYKSLIENQNLSTTQLKYHVILWKEAPVCM